MKIYVVTQGEYSGYGIIAVTLDKSLAEAIAKKFDSEHYHTTIEEFADAEIMLRPCWFVRFREDGSVATIENSSTSVYDYRNIGKCEFDPSGGIIVSVTAEDSDAAIKIAAEKASSILSREKYYHIRGRWQSDHTNRSVLSLCRSLVLKESWRQKTCCSTYIGYESEGCIFNIQGT